MEHTPRGSGDHRRRRIIRSYYWPAAEREERWQAFFPPTIRPDESSNFEPIEGYYEGNYCGLPYYLLSISPYEISEVTKELITSCLGGELTVTVEQYGAQESGPRRMKSKDFESNELPNYIVREAIDQFHELIFSCGCTGIIFSNVELQRELQVSPTNELYIFAENATVYDPVLRHFFIPKRPTLRTISDVSHSAMRIEHHASQFRALCDFLGCEERGNNALLSQ